MAHYYQRIDVTFEKSTQSQEYKYERAGIQLLKKNCFRKVSDISVNKEKSFPFPVVKSHIFYSLNMVFSHRRNKEAPRQFIVKSHSKNNKT